MYQAQGRLLLVEGKYREARELLVRASARHQSAVVISRSDGSVYEVEANDWIRVMDADAKTGALVLDAWKVVSGAVNQIMITNP